MSSASALECRKPESETKAFDFSPCLSSPGLKWAVKAPAELTPENIRRGPPVKPELSAAENQSGIVFCRFLPHRFSSPGSAKFKCSRTTKDNVLLDSKGTPVPEAQAVSSDEMKIQVSVDGKTEILGEGFLLDGQGQPIEAVSSDGKRKLLKSDVLKIKYFVDIKDPVKMRQRQDYQFLFDGQNILLRKAFVGPTEISIPRWNEVFTEVASTRLFWALGYPADVMIPLQKIVCFGCDPHPKAQKSLSPGSVSIYHFPVMERKFKGSKIADFFNMNSTIAWHYPLWKEETKNDFEGLAVLSQLIGYHNFINLQNRLQCEAGKLDEATGVCSNPVPFMQDLGSTWSDRATAAEREEMGLDDNPRGNLKFYQRGRVFERMGSCRLFYRISSHAPSESKAGPGLLSVTREGVEPLKEKLRKLSPEAIRSIFEAARFADMEPARLNSTPGSTLEEKRKIRVDEWARALEKRIQEVLESDCPLRGGRQQGWRRAADRRRWIASELAALAPQLPKAEVKKAFKSMSESERDENIRWATVTRRDYQPDKVAEVDLLSHLQKQCGPAFQYVFSGAQWPELECRYHPDSGRLGGYSLKFTCDFPDAGKKRGFDRKKVKYARSEAKLGGSEVLESIVAPLLTQLIGFYSETYCPVVITCHGCPSTSPWDHKRASAPAVPGRIVKIPWAVVEKEVKSITIANRDSYPSSQGLQWNELRKVQSGNSELNRQMRIEREAWVLWMSFLQTTDSHDANQRISCIDDRIGSDGKPECRDSVLYTHDYGHAFLKRFQFHLWKSIPALLNAPDGAGCQGTLGRPHADVAVKGLVLKPRISAEARNLLVERLKRITDRQLEVIYNLAKLQRTVNVSLQEWTMTLRRKIWEMEGALCQGLDSAPFESLGKTVLSR